VAIDPVHFFPLGDEKGQEGRVLASNTLVRKNTGIYTLTQTQTKGQRNKQTSTCLA
jgi:hypothetical protein